MIDQEISYSDFLQKKQPFGRHHKIFFKEGTDAFLIFGESVFGRFLPSTSKRKVISPWADEHILKIDAPIYNNYNRNLNNGLSVDLYFKGVNFNEIDIDSTYTQGIF